MLCFQFISLLLLSFVPLHCCAYQCNAAKCVSPNCRCAGTAIPGGIPPKLAPQFITLSFDDGVQQNCFDTFQKPLLCNDYNVCGARYRATFFVSTDWSDYYLISQAHAWGAEIADHTMAHDQYRANVQDWWTEIQGARQYLSVLGGIPQSAITGFRTPFLNPNANTLTALKTAGGFMYDSSMVDSLSKQGSYVYPFTLDSGNPFCDDTTVDSTLCGSGGLNVPGLWEIPLTPLRDMTSPLLTPLTLMDLAGTGYANKLQILKLNFLDHYNGNRAPFHIPLHCSYSASNENLNVLNDFYNWVHSQYTDVYFVTYSQMMQWMKSPVPASQVPLQPYMKFVMPSIELQICDGFAHNADNGIDEGLVRTCYYTEKWFHSCTPCCPTKAPLSIYWTSSFALPCAAGSPTLVQPPPILPTPSAGGAVTQNPIALVPPPPPPPPQSIPWTGCSKLADGSYSDPADKHCFYRCVLNKDYHFCCPSVLIWDPVYSICNW
jgi:hypothetical protein